MHKLLGLWLSFAVSGEAPIVWLGYGGLDTGQRGWWAEAPNAVNPEAERRALMLSEPSSLPCFFLALSS